MPALAEMDGRILEGQHRQSGLGFFSNKLQHILVTITTSCCQLTPGALFFRMMWHSGC